MDPATPLDQLHYNPCIPHPQMSLNLHQNPLTKAPQSHLHPLNLLSAPPELLIAVIEREGILLPSE